MVQRHAFAIAAVALLAGCSAPPPGENVGTTSSAIFPNDQAAYEYFVGKGLKSFQAAGIVGNLDQESGDDPTALQAGGPGRGIAQWSVGGRWDTDTDDNAEWYATMEGQSVDSLQLQLGFIWYELSTFPSYGLADLQATTNVTDATVVFETDFEGCGECDQSTRITYAEEALTAFGADGGGGGAGEDAGNSDGVGTPCTVTATGQSGTCLETSTCAAKGGVSTADYCPGPTNVQCCTGLSDAAARPPKEDAAAPEEPDAATRDAAAAHDAATTHAMTHGESHDASGGDAGDLAPTQAGCGCRMTPRMPRGEGVLLLAIASIAARRRRRR